MMRNRNYFNIIAVLYEYESMRFPSAKLSKAFAWSISFDKIRAVSSAQKLVRIKQSNNFA